MSKEFLPVGSVVMLKGGSKRVMIAGYLAIDNNDESKVYDYSGCLYPEGFLSSNETLLFDHEQIDKVYFEGLKDEEQELFMKQLNEIVKGLKEVSKEELPKKVDTLDVEE